MPVRVARQPGSYWSAGTGFFIQSSTCGWGGRRGRSVRAWR